MEQKQSKTLAFLIVLAETYEKEIPMSRLKIYEEILADDFENLSTKELYKAVVRNCKFFPSPAELLEIAGLKPETDRSKAENFVDQCIHLFTTNSQEAYNILGGKAYKLAKSIGMDPYGLKTGSQDAKFSRSMWVDRAEKAIAGKSPEFTQIEAKKFVELVASKRAESQPDV